MSGELDDIAKLFKISRLIGLEAAQGRHSDEEKYGFPEAWKARLPNMVEHAIPSEVLDLIEALNTTELAIPEQEAIQLLIETYENGAKSALASIPVWEREQNSRMVEAQKKCAEADRLRAEALRTGKVTMQQALEARKRERSINNPKHPDNPYLNLQKNPLFRKK
jgi:hypothetical protein